MKILFKIAFALPIILIIYCIIDYTGVLKKPRYLENTDNSSLQNLDINIVRSYQNNWQYDFENGWNSKKTWCSEGQRNPLAKEWKSSQMQTDFAGTTVPDPLNLSNKFNNVMKFVWQKGEGKKCDPNSQKKAHLYGENGDINKAEYWSFDILFPSNGMQKDQEGEIIIQWHDFPDEDCFKEGKRNPALALAIENDELQVTWIYDIRKCTPFWYRNAQVNDIRTTKTLGKVPKDKWTNFEFYIKFDPFGNGFLQVYQNKIKLIDEKNLKIGFNDFVGPFLGFGIYKYSNDSDFDQRIIYFDNIKQTVISRN